MFRLTYLLKWLIALSQNMGNKTYVTRGMMEYFKKRRLKKKAEEIKKLKIWYKKGFLLVKEYKPKALWRYIKDSISFYEADISFGGFEDCYITFVLSDYDEISVNDPRRIKALHKALNKIYLYKFKKYKQ